MIRVAGEEKDEEEERGKGGDEQVGEEREGGTSRWGKRERDALPPGKGGDEQVGLAGGGKRRLRQAEGDAGEGRGGGVSRSEGKQGGQGAGVGEWEEVPQVEVERWNYVEVLFLCVSFFRPPAAAPSPGGSAAQEKKKQ